ncbi:Peptidyl-prolyl cis-trans isomerase FKBP8 [Nymphon striatum]|nr:Peptidyl-prolyl cis-trans isomerase FKBP8 [Nymphon striatum]
MLRDVMEGHVMGPETKRKTKNKNARWDERWKVLCRVKRREPGPQHMESGVYHEKPAKRQITNDDEAFLLDSCEAPEDELQIMLDERVFVYNNLAAAQLQIKAFDAALKSSDNVLQFQPHNTKALFRKAKAYKGKGSRENCIKLLRRAIKYDQDSVEIQQELSIALNEQKKFNDKEKQMYRKMLGLENLVKEKSKKKVNFWTVAVGTIAIAALGYFAAHHFNSAHA